MISFINTANAEDSGSSCCEEDSTDNYFETFLIFIFIILIIIGIYIIFRHIRKNDKVE